MKLVFPSNRELMNNELVPSTLNRFEPLTCQKVSSSCRSEPSGSLCSGEHIDNMHADVNLVGNNEGFPNQL